MDTKILKLAANSSNSARAQLAEVTAEQFLGQGREFTTVEIELFNDIFCKLYEFASSDIKTRVSATFATSAWAPDELLGKIAKDDIEFAGPILAHSETISEKSLLAVIEEKGTTHQTLIASRKNIGEQITEALIAIDNSEVAIVLSSNFTAKISQSNFAKLVEKAKANEIAVKNLQKRTDLPPEARAIIGTQDVINAFGTNNSLAKGQDKKSPFESNGDVVDYSREPIIETAEQKELMSIINSGNENKFLVIAANKLEFTQQKLLNFISSNSAVNYGLLARALDLQPAATTKVFGLFNRVKIMDQREFNKVINSIYRQNRAIDAWAKLKTVLK